MSEVLGDAEPVDDPRDDRGGRDDRGDRYDRGADRLDDTAARRTPQMLAGASVLVAIFAGLEAATALILVANAHLADNFGG